MLSAAWRTSHNQARGSCSIDRLPVALNAGANEWVLHGCFHDQIDWPAKQCLQGVVQVLLGRHTVSVTRKVSDKQVNI
jgi:hypothetical protein